MTLALETLRQSRDQALRDLIEFDQQVADGEIPATVAVRVRRDYERAAADALAALDHAERSNSARGRATRRPTGKTVLYLAAIAVALLAVAVLLPRSIDSRPPGGAVTGNEVLQTPTVTPTAPFVPPGGRR